MDRTIGRTLELLALDSTNAVRRRPSRVVPGRGASAPSAPGPGR